MRLLPTPKMGLKETLALTPALSPRRGEARTVPGIFTPFGVELLHGDLRRRLRFFRRALRRPQPPPGSVRRDLWSAAFDLLEQKNQRNTGEAYGAEKPEVIDKCPEFRLLDQFVVNQTVSLHHRGDRTVLRRHRRLRRGQPLHKRGIVSRQVRYHERLVRLSATLEHGRHKGDPDAATQVAHQIEKPGGIAHLFLAQMPHG